MIHALFSSAIAHGALTERVPGEERSPVVLGRRPGNPSRRRFQAWGFGLAAFMALSSDASSNQVQSAALDCPDETCVRIVGEGFGTEPAVEIRSGTISWTIRYSGLSYSPSENGPDVIWFAVPRIEQLLVLDAAGLDVAVVNNQTLARSNVVRVTRSLPRFQFRNTSPLMQYEAGGTNYTVTRLANQPRSFAGVRTLLGYFHEEREATLANLAAMHLGGQRKLSIVIWYTIEALPNCRGRLTLEIRDGAFCPQYLQNLAEIAESARLIGYDEIVVRFANLGTVDPGAWTQLDLGVTRQVTSAIQSVRDLLDLRTPSRPGFRVKYDLCLECAGLEQGMWREFILALHDAYVARYGVEDTFVASVAYYPGNLSRMVDMLRQNGRPLPAEFGIDMYESGDSETGLFRLLQELDRLGLPGHPVTILEAYYNAPNFSQAVAKARSMLRLNVRTVYQWQLRSPQGFHFDVTPPVDFDHYRSLLAAIDIHRMTPLKASSSRQYLVEHTGGTDCAAVEVYSSDGLQELIGIAPGSPIASDSVKTRECLFTMPESPRVAGPPVLRLVGLNGGLSPVTIGR